MKFQQSIGLEIVEQLRERGFNAKHKNLKPITPSMPMLSSEGKDDAAMKLILISGLYRQVKLSDQDICVEWDCQS